MGEPPAERALPFFWNARPHLPSRLAARSVFHLRRERRIRGGGRPPLHALFWSREYRRRPLILALSPPGDFDFWPRRVGHRHFRALFTPHLSMGRYVLRGSESALGHPFQPRASSHPDHLDGRNTAYPRRTSGSAVRQRGRFRIAALFR